MSSIVAAKDAEVKKINVDSLLVSHDAPAMNMITADGGETGCRSTELLEALQAERMFVAAKFAEAGSVELPPRVMIGAQRAYIRALQTARNEEVPSHAESLVFDFEKKLDHAIAEIYPQAKAAAVGTQL